MMVEEFSIYTRSDLSRILREEPQVLEKVRTHPPDLLPRANQDVLHS